MMNRSRDDTRIVALTRFQREIVTDLSNEFIRELKSKTKYGKGSAVAPYKAGMLSSLRSLIRKVEDL